MGSCQSNNFDIIDWAFGKGHCKERKAITWISSYTDPKTGVKYNFPPPQTKPKIQHEVTYTRPWSKNIEEAEVNYKIDYIIYGLEHDMFPANYSHSGRRRSWGVGTDIPSDIKVDPEVFAFDNLFKNYMYQVIKYSKSLNGNYGCSSSPQLILDYKNGKYILSIECYTRHGSMYLNAKCTMYKDVARMYLRTMIEEGLNVYDLYNEIATYENKRK
jgi:hypothetical protein